MSAIPPTLSSRGQQPPSGIARAATRGDPSTKIAPTVAEAQRAFLAARRTVFGHLIFVVLCCVLTFILRKLLHLPSIMIGAVFFAAFVVFATDIIRMFICRHHLKRALNRESHA